MAVVVSVFLSLCWTTVFESCVYYFTLHRHHFFLSIQDKLYICIMIQCDGIWRNNRGESAKPKKTMANKWNIDREETDCYKIKWKRWKTITNTHTLREKHINEPIQKKYFLKLLRRKNHQMPQNLNGKLTCRRSTYSFRCFSRWWHNFFDILQRWKFFVRRLFDCNSWE